MKIIDINEYLVEKQNHPVWTQIWYTADCMHDGMPGIHMKRRNVKLWMFLDIAPITFLSIAQDATKNNQQCHLNKDKTTTDDNGWTSVHDGVTTARPRQQ